MIGLWPRQTWVLLCDAYRELSSRKLLWLSLVISLVVVVFFAMFDINEQGLLILGYQTPLEFFNTTFISKAAFFKLLFYTFGFGVWLSWASMALALISTAHIFPDFVSSGSIEMSLSKPIGRLRLFVTKYVLSLLFVAVQVTLFTIAAFVVVGLKSGEWEWRFFWGVPLVVLVFSYLFGVCVLVGTLTRSSMTALLVTGVVWLVAFIAHGVETEPLLGNKIRYQIAAASMAEGVKARRDGVAATRAAVDGGAQPTDAQRAALADAERDLADWLGAEGEVQENLDALTTAHAVGFGIKMFLPKTNETLEMLRYAILSEDDLGRLVDRAQRNRAVQVIGKARVQRSAVEKERLRVLASRDAWWIIGTSMAFQAVVVGLAAWRFCRRDF